MTAMQELQSPAPSLQLQKTQIIPYVIPQFQLKELDAFEYLTFKLHNTAHAIWYMQLSICNYSQKFEGYITFAK
jgi:hypothetical protein